MSAGDLAPVGAVSSEPPAPSAVSRQSSPVRGEEERGGEGRREGGREGGKERGREGERERGKERGREGEREGRREGGKERGRDGVRKKGKKRKEGESGLLKVALKFSETHRPPVHTISHGSISIDSPTVHVFCCHFRPLTVCF